VTLPYSRNTDYSPGSPVKSYDLNDLQDAVVNLYRSEGWVPLPLVGRFDQCSYNEVGGYVENSGAPWSAALPLAFWPGVRIKALRIARSGNGASSLSLRLKKIELVGTALSASAVKTTTVASPPSAWASTELTLTATEWLTTGRNLAAYLSVDGAGASSTQRFSLPEVLVDRP
jgi:hypothetical protein